MDLSIRLHGMVLKHRTTLLLGLPSRLPAGLFRLASPQFFPAFLALFHEARSLSSSTDSLHFITSYAFHLSCIYSTLRRIVCQE